MAEVRKNNRRCMRSMLCGYLLVLFLSSLCAAALAAESRNVYNIDDKLEAYFPAAPNFRGARGSGQLLTKTWGYFNEDDNVSYTATIGYGPFNFKKSDIPEALRNYALGDAMGINGTLVDYEQTLIGSSPGYVSIVDYQIDGLKFQKYSIAVLHGGRFLSWTVHGLKGYSDLRAIDAFAKFMDSFRPR